MKKGKSKLSIKAGEVYSRLYDYYPDAKCSLDYENPLQLLVATQLAAQCTDKRVNLVTPALFKKYKTANDFAKENIEDLEEAIRTTGFFRNKAKNIQACCRILVSKYNSEVPSNMEELLELPGVGRKTANVVRGEAFGIPGIVIDTHAGRISYRLGLTKHKDPTKVEYDLMKLLPPETWMKFCHLLIELGRDICQSRKPKCERCLLNDICDEQFS